MVMVTMSDRQRAAVARAHALAQKVRMRHTRTDLSAGQSPKNPAVSAIFSRRRLKQAPAWRDGGYDKYIEEAFSKAGQVGLSRC